MRCHFRDRPDVYVSGNLFIYYREGDPQAAEARVAELEARLRQAGAPV
ncbi:MAG: hypothetical protein OXQ31_13935 [Spirochaetaceae bacterium]|nr:hypothetical protein [Spirochaetaceae bacterium]